MPCQCSSIFSPASYYIMCTISISLGHWFKQQLFNELLKWISNETLIVCIVMKMDLDCILWLNRASNNVFILEQKRIMHRVVTVGCIEFGVISSVGCLCCINGTMYSVQYESQVQTCTILASDRLYTNCTQVYRTCTHIVQTFTVYIMSSHTYTGALQICSVMFCTVYNADRIPGFAPLY